MITDTQALADFCEKLRTADYVTVDTEFMREKTYWPILCLVQLAGPGGAKAVDALAPGIDLKPLHKLGIHGDVIRGAEFFAEIRQRLGGGGIIYVEFRKLVGLA